MYANRVLKPNARARHLPPTPVALEDAEAQEAAEEAAEQLEEEREGEVGGRAGWGWGRRAGAGGRGRGGSARAAGNCLGFSRVRVEACRHDSRSGIAG